MSLERRVEEILERPLDAVIAREELEQLIVFADYLAERGSPEGESFAFWLRYPSGDNRLLLWGYTTSAEPWERELAEVIREVATARDVGLAARLLSWVGTMNVGVPLHQVVADHLNDMLHAVELRELAVMKSRGSHFDLANGWTLEVFFRGYDFWRIDYVVAPGGHRIALIDFDDGPLAEVNDYEPPEDVEDEVYRRSY